MSYIYSCLVLVNSLWQIYRIYDFVECILCVVCVKCCKLVMRFLEELTLLSFTEPFLFVKFGICIIIIIKLLLNLGSIVDS